MAEARPAAARALKLIADLCESVCIDAPAGQDERVRLIHDRLGQPLHVAVAGRVKSGKSTFVNALLGQRVARTDARECTRAVTWFRYGPSEKITVVTRDGVLERRRHDRRRRARNQARDDQRVYSDQRPELDRTPGLWVPRFFLRIWATSFVSTLPGPTSSNVLTPRSRRYTTESSQRTGEPIWRAIVSRP